MPKRGNGNQDVLSGTNGNDVLRAQAPGQVLKGGGGDDVYFVDDVSQAIIERNNGGHDLVMSSVDWWLEDHAEDLTLTGLEDLSGTGNALDNFLTGNDGDNQLSGGDGNDTLSGGLGDDVFFGGTGQNQIDGGEGADSAHFDGESTDYAISLEDDVVTVTSAEGDTTILTGVEHLVFGDVTIDTADLAGVPPAPALQAVDDLAGGGDEEELRISVLENDIGQGVTIASVTQGAFGTVEIADGGIVVYRPAPGAAGTDSFSYTIQDAMGATSTARVEVEILAPPEPLVASDDHAALDEDTTVVIPVLANDVGTGLVVTSVSDGQKGSVTIREDGTLLYTANPDATGQDVFAYEVTDQNGQITTGSVTVEIAPVNDAPEASDDAFAVGAGEAYQSSDSLFVNDGDVDGDALTLLGYDAQSAAGGAVSVAEDGTFSYTPPEGFSGADSFGYTIQDASRATSSAMVELSVSEPAPPEPDPLPEEVPYYVDALIYGGDARLNAPDPFGTAEVVTFAFLEAPPDYYYADSFVHDGFRTFSDQQREATYKILAEIESFANLTFVEVAAEDAELTLGLADLPGLDGLAFKPSSDGVGVSSSDVWLDAAYAGDAFVSGTQQFHTLLHEIGHALGLRHSALDGEEDSLKYTVMDSAFHPSFDGSATGYQVYDIAALQHLYGANDGATATDDTYDFSQLGDKVATVWDGGGTDTIDMSAATYGVTLDLAEGAHSTVAAAGSNNVAIAFGAEIENAIGSDHDDSIVGNDLDNQIWGGGGSDTLSGGLGNDTFGFDAESGSDLIEDFVSGEDKIAVTGLTLADLTLTVDEGGLLVDTGTSTLRLANVEALDEEEDFLFV